MAAELYTHGVVGHTDSLVTSSPVDPILVSSKGPPPWKCPQHIVYRNAAVVILGIHFAQVSVSCENHHLLVRPSAIGSVFPSMSDSHRMANRCPFCNRGNTFHYLLHGCHHKHPMDGYRLVFPPAFTALFCAFVRGSSTSFCFESCFTRYTCDYFRKILYGLSLASVLTSFPYLCIVDHNQFWSILRVACPYTAAPSVFGGGLLGYVIYDVTHYCLHHGAPVGLFFKKLKVKFIPVSPSMRLPISDLPDRRDVLRPRSYGTRSECVIDSDLAGFWQRYHLNHHFKVQTDGFGITSSLWDRVFGTLPSGV